MPLRTITAKPAAGPETPTALPEMGATTRPPRMPAMSPARGGAPEARAMPRQSGRATRIVMMTTTTLVAIGTVVIAAGRTITSTVRNANAWTAPTNPRATIASMISKAVVDQKITSEISTAMITSESPAIVDGTFVIFVCCMFLATTRVATGTRVTAAARQTTTNFAKTARYASPITKSLRAAYSYFLVQTSRC